MATVEFRDGKVSPVGLVKIDLRTLGHRFFSVGSKQGTRTLIPTAATVTLQGEGLSRGGGAKKCREIGSGRKPCTKPAWALSDG